MEQVFRQALTHLGADEVDHHGRALTEHLLGTWRLLEEWRNPPSVASAGAFHSVYGTEEFKTKTLPLSKRSAIAALIGSEAEELVYLFCLADRRGFYKQPDSGPFSVLLPANGERIEIDNRIYASLLEIEAANIVEQAMHQTAVPDHVVSFWLQAFDSKRCFLSAGAAAAYRSALSGYAAAR